jgi:ADP-heptose:LPS heptosyltransferase
LSTYVKQLADRYLGYLLIGFFLPITRLLGYSMKRDHTLTKPPQVILFIKILGLGSLIVSSEAIREIRRKYPNTKFILLTDTNIAEGIAPFKFFDEYWTITSGNVFSVLFRSLLFLIKSWRLKNMWVVDLEVYSKLTTVYALMTFALNRFGFYLSPVFFRKYLNTHNIHFDQSAFLADNYRSMAESIMNEKTLAQSLINRSRKNEAAKKFIALNNTCSDLAFVRKLPDSTFAEICQWLLENTSYELAILGAPKDNDKIRNFLAANSALDLKSERVTIIAGQYNFTTYYDFLSEQCACLITIDSGPLHMARLLGVPTVSVWGPTNPSSYLKILPEEKERHLYHYSNVHCAPCVHLTTKLPCGGDNFCMKTIGADIIIKKIKTLLVTLKSAGV